MNTPKSRRPHPKAIAAIKITPPAMTGRVPLLGLAAQRTSLLLVHGFRPTLAMRSRYDRLKEKRFVRHAAAALVATHNERTAARMDRVPRLHEGHLDPAAAVA